MVDSGNSIMTTGLPNLGVHTSSGLSTEVDFLIVGGGFFGCILAVELDKRGKKVMLCEREEELLLRASYNNQARVHNGYHYPRSLLTALRSRVNFHQFIRDYEDCIFRDFNKYYAVPYNFSKVSAVQFRRFIERIEAPISDAPEEVKELFNEELVEAVYSVTEYAFDAAILREIVKRKLTACTVDLRMKTDVCELRKAENGNLRVGITDRQTGAQKEVLAQRVYNCTYSEINRLVTSAGLQPVTLKHELTELSLVEPPPELQDFSITMMCGPFFSFMPFPDRGYYTLSHVRYTPHTYWHDRGDSTYRSAYGQFEVLKKKSRFEHMVRDASRYVPALRSVQYRDSLWEVKTILPLNEADDGRPILFYDHQDLPRLTSIMGGKIDNVYDAIEEMDRLHLS